MPWGDTPCGTDLVAPRGPRVRWSHVLLLGVLGVAQSLPAFLHSVRPEMLALQAKPPGSLDVTVLVLLKIVAIPTFWTLFESKFGLTGLRIALGVGFTLVGGAVAGALMALRCGTWWPASALLGAVLAAGSAGAWAMCISVPRATAREQIESDRLRLATEVARLRSRTEPHFLLNTLSVVSALMGRDLAGARAVLADLGDLLRSLASRSSELVSVQEELEWLRRYVRILEVRHGSLLRVEWEVDEDAADCLIPAFLLQPLLENAVQHGVMGRAEGGCVRIAVALDQHKNSICLQVEDDGPGFAGQREGGLGIELVRQKAQLFSPLSKVRFETSARAGLRPGTRCTIDLPINANDK
jgi:two-component sensor histidine kinase